MQNQNQNKYIPPLVLDHVELETESPILTGSGDGPFKDGVKTSAQYYYEKDFETGEFNTTWEISGHY